MKVNIKSKDFIFPLILSIILLLFIFLNYFYFGSVVFDCGREYLVPEAVNKGNILIKDIFISYFPLSYQINSIVFKILGANLDSLRVMGILASVIDIVFYYFIARFFTNEIKSFLIALTVSFFTMFNVSYLFNYVMGYSYACTYATVFFTAGTYFGINYIKSNNKKRLFLSVLLSGVSFALKAEFIFLIIPYILLILYKKENLKNSFVSVVLFFTPIILSFLALFISGFKFSDFIQYIEFMKNFMSSKILADYTYTVARHDPQKWFELAGRSFRWFVNSFIVYYLVLILPVKFNKKILCWILTVGLFIGYSYYAVIRNGFVAVSMFSFLCIALVPVCGLLIYFYKKSEDNEKTNIEAVLFLILIQLALVIRHNFIYTANHSAYTMGIGILASFAYLDIIVKNKYCFNKIFTAFMVTIGIINTLYFSVYNHLFANYPIKSEKGIMKTSENNLGEIVNKTLDFMNRIDEDKTVLILPEGHMLNFLSNRKTNLKYYQLLPNHIETLGEKNIIENLDKNKPDYILFQTNTYGVYGTPYICKDFGLELCSYTYKNYNQVKIFANSGSFMVIVYKVK